jgi:enolase
MGTEIFHRFYTIGVEVTAVGDEGGFAPNLLVVQKML